MAINKSEFTEIIETNLKSNKQFNRFYINFKKDHKRTEKILDFKNKDWDKRTRISKAKQTLIELKDKQSNDGININENSSLGQVTDVYFQNREDSKWTKELRDVYRVHIESTLGKKKIKDIRRVHLDTLVTKMKKKGLTKQTLNGCSPRTIKKVIIETLKPILQYAVDNNVIDKLPSLPIIKLNRKKKTVTNATETFSTLYKTIFILYKDNPFYLTLFLFLFFGRRWNEVRTLKWSDIDLINNIYTIRAENNKINQDQTYDIPLPIRDSFDKMKDNKEGLLFKSPITGRELYPPKVQVVKIREASGIENLTLHYFRHILVSALGEMGTAGTILSASLGHTNLTTVDTFYRTANYTKASVEANATIGKLLQNTKLNE